MKKAILKSTGRTYIVGKPDYCGTKEENEAKKAAGKIYYKPVAYGRIRFIGRIEKDGKPWGATRSFFSDELEFID